MKLSQGESPCFQGKRFFCDEACYVSVCSCTTHNIVIINRLLLKDIFSKRDVVHPGSLCEWKALCYLPAWSPV